jgi:hypothetical protein
MQAAARGTVEGVVGVLIAGREFPGAGAGVPTERGLEEVIAALDGEADAVGAGADGIGEFVFADEAFAGFALDELSVLVGDFEGAAELRSVDTGLGQEFDRGDGAAHAGAGVAGGDGGVAGGACERAGVVLRYCAERRGQEDN